MQGFETLCLPGTDHAGICHPDEGRAGAFRGRRQEPLRPWARSHARPQLSSGRKNTGEPSTASSANLGLVTDWRRERFTLDEGYVEAVLQAFAHFAEQGWIYRGTRMINWCPQCQTVISDLETERARNRRSLVAHPLSGPRGEVRAVVVATTRPETMLGDTAVAVHPSDDRWQACHWLPSRVAADGPGHSHRRRRLRRPHLGQRCRQSNAGPRPQRLRNRAASPTGANSSHWL